MCLDVVNRPREDILTAYQSIKRHSDSDEYFFPDHDHHSYYFLLSDLHFPWTLTFGEIHSYKYEST